MSANQQSIKIKKDVIELHDIVISDSRIEDYYGCANEILFKENNFEVPSSHIQKELQKMRTKYLRSR